MTATASPLAILTPISRVAAQLGVTNRALRHYEALGLVASARPKGNARAYDSRAIQRLELIVALRSADLPLETIADILGREADPQAQTQRVVSLIDAALDRARLAVERLEAARQAAGRQALPGMSRPDRRAGRALERQAQGPD